VSLGGDLDGALEPADLGVERAEQVEPGLDPAAGVQVGDVGGDGLDPEGVPEGEGDRLAAAGVGQPVPRVDALAADEQVGAERGDGGEERVRLGGEVAGQPDGAGGVEDADEQRPCVQIDPDVGCGRLRQ